MKRCLWLAFLTAAVVSAVWADTKEEAIGLILAPGSAKVLRANTETPLAARAGDILFSGDALKTADSPASFLFCPDKKSETLDPSGEVLLDSKALKVKSGKLDAPKPVNACFLPQVVRVAVASQQHYGVSMSRGLVKPQGDVIPFDQLAASVKSELQPFEDILKSDPNNAAANAEEASVFDREKLEANALASYQKVSQQWPDAIWVKGRIFDLQESLANEAAIKAAAISPDAKTYALMIGISEYEKVPKDLWLKFADADAKTFSEHMASLRGGGVPADQMTVLTNQQATTAAVRNAMDTFLRNRAGKNDTVFVLIAGHGATDSRGAYILTYDSDPQDLSTTAIPISEIQALLDDELAKVGRVVLMADLAHVPQIDNLKTAAVGTAVEKLGEAQGQMLGIMSARPKELSEEGTQFGGGHGAFTYSLVKGLEGSADHGNDPYVSAGQLIDYVRTNVPELTANKQHPRDFGAIENATKLSNLTEPGITVARYKTVMDSKNGGPLYLADAFPQDAQTTTQANQDVDAFQSAVKNGRLLPNQTGSAWDLLDKLRNELPQEQLFLQENDLRVALENAAQQVLLRYLAGDQNPQTKDDFDAGSRFMEAAIRLTPESLYLQGRDDFFSGRAMLYDKQYSQAANLLEQSVRIDPGEAYGYNALGIAYLEQADFAKSIPAFRDAARKAPNWSYPLHNLALAYVEAGDYDDAIKSYQQAMKITPQFSYLPYNLGLVYQRTNRRREAEIEYRHAMALAPNSAMPLNALGTLKASEGKNAEAEKFYRDALQKDPSLLEARHNLALLLESIKGRQNEAIALFRQNLAAKPDFIASELSLAELLARTGDTNGAIEQYEAVVKAKPDYLAARSALGGLYLKANQPEKAVEQFRAAAKVDSQNPAIWEQIGDAEKAAGHSEQAKEAYASALKLQVEKSSRKRINAKMAF